MSDSSNDLLICWYGSVDWFGAASVSSTTDSDAIGSEGLACWAKELLVEHTIAVKARNKKTEMIARIMMISPPQAARSEKGLWQTILMGLSGSSSLPTSTSALSYWSRIEF